MSSTDSRPPMTEREASRREAEAGILGRQQAQAAGADPHQLKVMMRAAGQGTPPKAPAVIGGIALYDMCLAVSVANDALKAHPHAGAVSGSLSVARLAYLFHDPVAAYQSLSSGSVADMADMDAEALELVGRWGAAELQEFAAYLKAVQPAQPSPDEEAPAGKPERRNRKPLRPGRGR